MKSRRNFDVMKDTLCAEIEAYIRGMEVSDLYEFVTFLNENQEELSNRCGNFHIPEEVLTCERCEEKYGDCQVDIGKEKDLTRICHRRFRSYSETPVSK